jgi:hypothetical protein
MSLSVVAGTSINVEKLLSSKAVFWTIIARKQQILKSALNQP